MKDKWINLAPYWDELRKLADARDEQKGCFSSSEYMNKDAHFIGLCGEKAYSVLTGRAMNTDLVVKGDGGTDFSNGVNVKTSTFHNPDLLVRTNKEHWPLMFVVFQLDMDGKRARPVGCASTQRLVRPERIMEFGYGPTYCIRNKDLDEFLMILHVKLN